MGKIGVYGGSFNPIHLGHIHAAREMADRLCLDQVFMIPAAQPPHKTLPAYSPTGGQRLEMVRLAVQGDPRLKECDLELQREGKSYTVQTLHQLKELYPDDELYLLMGTDMFMGLDHWYQSDEICRLAHIVCISREEKDKKADLEKKAAYLRNNLKADVSILPSKPVEMNSTTIRRMIFFGCADDYLAEDVYAYIRQNHLYGADLDWTGLSFERLSARSLDLHKTERVAHVIGVSKTAAKLAERYGARIDHAMRAGILHDVTKALDGPEQLCLCRHFGIQLTPFEETHPKLLHSKTGAAVAERIFGERQETCEAIFWHTTGCAEMTLLDKILYIADYAEPNRCFDGVEYIREVLYQDLDLALFRGFGMSLEELEREGKPLDRHSIEAYDFIKKERGFA